MIGDLVKIRRVTESDSKAITEIYNHYVATSLVTFEETQLTESAMSERIRLISSKYPYLVTEYKNEVVAYAYANEWKSRSAYRFTVETSIYVKNGFEGRGIGFGLYTELLKETQRAGFKHLIGGITMPNDSSIRLHESLGYEKVGVFHNVGFKFNQWADVGYWEKRFD